MKECKEFMPSIEVVYRSSNKSFIFRQTQDKKEPKVLAEYDALDCVFAKDKVIALTETEENKKYNWELIDELPPTVAIATGLKDDCNIKEDDLEYREADEFNPEGYWYNKLTGKKINNN